MIIKLKKEYTKKCLKHHKFSLFKLVKIYFYLILLFFINTLYANDCSTKKTLKVGITENNLIEYQYYLYYELGNYAANKNLEFEIKTLKNNPHEFDIIFGEYYDLVNYSSNRINLPVKIEEFFNNNNLTISDNILPLDLDTFLIVSKSNNEKINTLEELSNIYDPVRYTLGISFKSSNQIAQLINYNNNMGDFDLKTIENESLMRSLNKSYKNSNKNILISNFIEIYNSYENDENVFTVFSDGVLLNKNFEYLSYQLFPQSKYKWSNDEGIFIRRGETIPYSFFGFSAYINDTDQFGFLCHLVKDDVRENSFKNFDISLSPISSYEVKNFESLPIGYLDILESKNKNISDVNYKDFNNKYNLFKNIIFGSQIYRENIELMNYLNETD